jgi:hypothetical protein
LAPEQPKPRNLGQDMQLGGNELQDEWLASSAH